MDLGLILFGALLGGLVGLFIGRSVQRSHLGFFMGFFFGPLGWIVVLLMPRKESETPLWNEQPDLSSNRYRTWLTDFYAIKKNDLSNQFDCKGRSFNTLEESVNYAHKLHLFERIQDKRESRFSLRIDALLVIGLGFVALIAMYVL